MIKRCFTMVSCPLRYQCACGNSSAAAFFQPLQVGEHCDFYQSIRPQDEDLAEKLMRMAGATE